MTSFSASAEMTKLHNAWHEYIDVFTVDGKVFDIRLGESENSLLRVKVDNVSGFIAFKKCEQFDIYTVCYQNKSLDVAQTSISDSGKTMPGLLINITKDDLSTDLTFTPSTGKFNINEDHQINITIKNKKSAWIDSFTYELAIPTNMTVSSLGDFKITAPGRIGLTGSMPSNSQKIVSFTVSASSTGTKKMNYTLSLSSNDATKDTKGSFNLEPVNPYTATISITPSTQTVLDDSKLVINIKNTGSSDLELTNLTIRGYGDLNYFAGKDVVISGPDFYSIAQKEVLMPEYDKEYYMILTPTSTGKFNISITADLMYGGKKVVYSVNKTLISSASGFTPVLALSKDTVLSGSEFELYYEVSNTNVNSYFTNISVAITGAFISENLYLDKLSSSDSKVLLRKFIIAPALDKDQIFKITATTNYMTQSGEKKQINSTKNIKVTSAGSFLSVEQKVSPAEVYVGQEVIVDVNVKNMKDELFEVVASDVLPNGVEKIGGTTYKNFTLKGLASESAYMYKLKVPIDSNLTEFNVTSKARINSKNYDASDVTVIKVKRNTTTSSKVNKTTSINTSDIVVKNTSTGAVKKDTAFRRFFKSVEKFFTGIFKKK
jgi:hypothetical protein